MRYDPDGNLVPVLAAEIPSRANGGIAADGRSTVWKLKKGVRWHDGRPFTADDVVFNFAYATDLATAATTFAQYEGIAVATRIDAETVRFEFQKPTPLWHRGATVALVPKHLFEAFGGARCRGRIATALQLDAVEVRPVRRVVVAVDLTAQQVARFEVDEAVRAGADRL